MKPTSLLKTTFYTYRSVETVDSGGSPISAFSIENTLLGNIQPYRSSEAVKAGREWSNSMLKIYCADDSDIDMSDRVYYNNDFYNIVEKEIWNDTYMMLVCSRVD